MNTKTLIILSKTTLETIKGFETISEYAIELYCGPKFEMATYAGRTDLAEVRGYGLKLTRKILVNNPLPAETILDLQAQGYLFSKDLLELSWTKDYGFLTAQNHEINALTHRLSKKYFGSWEKTEEFIHVESKRWGEVIMENGKTLYHKEYPKMAVRNPFARAARQSLLKKLKYGTSTQEIAVSKEVDL